MQASVEALTADIARIDETTDALREPPKPLPFERTLSVRGVEIPYPARDTDAHTGVDLALHKSRSHAVVSHTGSGKIELDGTQVGTDRDMVKWYPHASPPKEVLSTSSVRLT